MPIDKWKEITNKLTEKQLLDAFHGAQDDIKLQNTMKHAIDCKNRRKARIKEWCFWIFCILLFGPTVIVWCLAFIFGEEITYHLPDWFSKWAVISLVGIGIFVITENIREHLTKNRRK